MFGDGKESFRFEQAGLEVLSWHIFIAFELQNIWLLRKVGYLQPVVKIENC